MHRKIPFLFVLIALFLASCAKPNFMLRLDPPMKSFVKIHNTMEIKSCKGKLPEELTECPVGFFNSTGSGMAVSVIRSETIIITAGHVCSPKVANFIDEHRNLIKVQDHKGIMHQAHLIKSSLDNNMGSPDMCALWVPSLNIKPVLISRMGLEVGEFIYYVGAPAGVYHPPTAPVLTGIYSGPIDASSSMVSAPAIGGSSGSVVLNSNNKMVGVLFATHPRFHHVTIITSFRSTMTFLDSVRRSFKKKI